VITLTAAISFMLAKNQADNSDEETSDRPMEIIKNASTDRNNIESSIERLRKDSENQSDMMPRTESQASPPSETPEEKERKCREMWELASDFADKNPLQAELSCANFENIKKKFPDLKYAAMAVEKINEIKNKAAELKTQKIEELMASLDKAAAPLIKAEDFQKAVAVYLDYKGNLSEESRVFRQKAAKKIIKNAEELKTQKERQLAETEKKKTEFFDTYLDYMLKADYRAASELCRLAEGIPMAADMKKYADELSDADKIILDSLEGDSGKYIAMETRDGRKMVKLKKLKGSAIYYEIKIGKGIAQEKTSVRNLAFSEKSKRLAEKVQPEASTLYIMAYTAKNGKPEHILKYTDKLPQPIREATERKLNTEKSEKHEENAALEFTKMLRKAGFKAESVNLSEIKAFIAEIPYTTGKQEEHKKLLSEYDFRFRDSQFLKNSKDLMDAFQIPEPEIKKAIKGKILFFNKATCEISIQYDFNDSAEFSDWENLSHRKRRSKASITEGCLAIGGDAPTIIVNRIPFKNLGVSFEGNSEGDFNELLFNPSSCLAFIIGGMGGRMDGYVTGMPPFRGPDCNFFRTGPSSMKSGEKISGTLIWNASSVSFSCNGKKWKELSYKQDFARFGLLAFRTENRYDSILLKGTIEKSWCDNPPEAPADNPDNQQEEDKDDNAPSWENAD